MFARNSIQRGLFVTVPWANCVDCTLEPNDPGVLPNTGWFHTFRNSPCSLKFTLSWIGTAFDTERS